MSTDILSQVLTIDSGTSKIAHNHGVIITVKDWNSSNANIVYGSPGGVNSSRRFGLGDASLYQTPDHGLIELRLMSIKSGKAEILLTKISPRLGFSASIDASDEENKAFAPDEILKIRTDLDRIKISMSGSMGLTQEQQDFLAVKLDEIESASERLGRKDWIMYVNGTITSLITGAAFAPEAASKLVDAFNSNLSWVFHNLLRLVGS